MGQTESVVLYCNGVSYTTCPCIHNANRHEKFALLCSRQSFKMLFYHCGPEDKLSANINLTHIPKDISPLCSCIVYLRGCFGKKHYIF